jgi:single-stranded-DNA-specific exonuclease
MNLVATDTHEPHVVTEPIKSFSGKIWDLRPLNDRLAQHIAQETGIEPTIAKILAARGMSAENVQSYLNPKLRDLMPDPFHFKDMDKAVDRISSAIRSKEKIAVYGDYDVDGATSSALMVRFLRHFGLNPTLYIPDRMTEGYGPNMKAFKMLHDSKHTLIITVDCGIVAFETMAFAAEKNLDVVILDHHMATAELPTAYAIVNPNRIDESGEYGYLAACAVTFLTLVALSQKLRLYDLTPPDLLSMIDLVALGTVCDVVPLIGLNRAFVAQGLKVMAKRQNIGLSALSNVARIDSIPTSYHAGFVLGPRINAAGRISVSQLGTLLLSTQDVIEAENIAEQLENLNRERQEIEKSAVEEAMLIATEQQDIFTHAIVLANEAWHPGVIGLIASRLKEAFQKPTCIITFDNDGKGKASCRSISDVDLGALVIQARMEGIIIEGGGHAMAAGFSIHREKIPTFLDFVTTTLKQKFGGNLPVSKLTIDASISPSAVTLPIAKQLQQMEPFGAGNAAPKLMIKSLRINGCTIVKEKHLRINFANSDNTIRFDSMMFNVVGSALHQKIQSLLPHNRVAVVGNLKVNLWQGREQAQFLTDDMALVE